jgi:hypothetical protein
MALSMIESGDGLGYTAAVDSGQKLLTKNYCLPRTLYSSLTLAIGTSGPLALTRTGRTAIIIQNVGAFAVNISLGSDAALGTDLTIAPGAMFSFPACNTFEGPIQVIAPGGNSNVRVIEFAD